MRIGLVGTRFAGLDGVTLESVKVANVLESLGHSVVWFAGRLDGEFSPGVEVPAAYFDTAANSSLNDRVFGHQTCTAATLDEIDEQAEHLRSELADFVRHHDVDVLMPQNASAIPMQVPLGVAISRYLEATQMPALAHHHDFGWERSRFWPNAIGALLEEAFPPSHPGLGHLVINSIARSELLDRKGLGSRLLPNIMDFSTAPEPADPERFKQLAGLAADDVVLLQPTRMVPRKGIEDSFELAARLGDDAIKVVVTHPEPDEGEDYVDELCASAQRLGVNFRVVPVGADLGATLSDAYAAADLVTYPSRIEGFGNALLEALYFKRPLLVNRYPVYVTDIEPLGVEAIEMDGRITDEVVAAVAALLEDPEKWSGAVERNYEIGRRHFSYSVASHVLVSALDDIVR